MSGFASRSYVLALLSLAFFPGLAVWAQPVNSVAERPQLALQLGHSLPIVALAYSPDGSLLVSGSNDNTVKIWDARSRELIRTIDAHTAPVRGVAFSPDGKNLATGDENGDVKLWNPQTGALKRSLPRLLVGVKKLEFSQDGRYFAAACGFRGTGLKRDTRGQWVLWDAHKFEVLYSEVSQVAFLSLAIAPDMSIVALGNADNEVKFFDTQTNSIRKDFKKLSSSPDQLVFSPVSKMVAAIDHKAVMILDAESGTEYSRLASPNIDKIYSLAFGPDGKSMVTSSVDTNSTGFLVTTRLWDIKDGREIQSWAANYIAHALCYSPDGKTLASGAAGQINTRLLNEGTKQDEGISEFRKRWIQAMAYSIDGKTLAVAGGTDGQIYLWNVRTGTLRRTLQGQKQQVRALSFSPDGKTLATASESGDGSQIVLWDVQSGSSRRRWDLKAPDVLALAFSPDGKSLVSGSDNNGWQSTTQKEEITFWSPQTGGFLRKMTGRPGYIASLTFSPNGKILASAQSGALWSSDRPSDNAVTLREAKTGQVARILHGHTDNISAVAFSPDNKLIASASKDKTVRLWDVKTGKLSKIFIGHTDWVRSLAFSPDGKTLVSGSNDNTLRLWDIAKGKIKRILNGHEADVSTVRFSPDGNTIASGSMDTTLNIWNARDGRKLVSLLIAPSQDSNYPYEPLWLAATPQGYYDCAEGADYLVKWRFGNKLLPFHHFEETYRRPDYIRKTIHGETLTARPLLLTRIPPTIRILAPLHGDTVTKNVVRILVEAADDSALGNSNFAFYVNGSLVPDDVAKPITVDGKPILVEGKPITVDGKPILVDGKPILVDGKPITAEGKPITADGRSVAHAQRVSERHSEQGETHIGLPTLSQYAFHRLYILDVPLPQEEKIVLRAVVSDNEANKSDDAIVLKHLDKAPTKGDLYVLTVGISNYRNPIYNLNYAAADARSISKTLSHQEGRNYAHVKSVVLVDANAHAENIRRSLLALKRAKPEDTVMVFLSGHGLQANGKTYFAPWGISISNITGTCLEWREIVDSLSQLYARKLLFIDACHSGAKLGAHQATSAQLAEVIRNESGIVMLASSQSDEFSFENKEVKQGEFSIALIKAFSGKADVDGDGDVTLPEVTMYVSEHVSMGTKGLQNPQLVLVQDFNPQTVLSKVEQSLSTNGPL